MKTMTGVSLGVLTILTLAACGGGGGGGGLSGTPATTAPTAPATAAPTIVTGNISSLDTGAPLAGASITIGTSPKDQTGIGSPLAPTTTATTDAAGNFSVTGLAAGAYIIQAQLNGYATLHALISVIPNSTTQLKAYKITVLSANDQTAIAGVNADRTANGVAGLVTSDEYAQETARAFASYMAANGVFGDQLGAQFFTAYTAAGGVFTALSANLAADNPPGSWIVEETTFMTEKANCPNGPANCVFTKATGHYLNIVNPNSIWIGVASATGKAYIQNPAQPQFTYYVQFFTQ